MEIGHDIDLAHRKLTTQLIVKRALERGWVVTGFKSRPALLLIKAPGITKPVKIYSSTPSGTSYAASVAAQDKYITNQILGKAGLPVPKEPFLSPVYSVTSKQLQDFLKECGTVVVKPLDAAHGKGITVGVTDLAKLKNAISKAENFSHKSIALVQEEIVGIDVRILCSNYKYVDAITRIPAYVKGDGVKSIKSLVDAVNASEERVGNYKGQLNTISVDLVEEHLGKKALSKVPPRDEIVQVIGVSNIGMGGTRQNINEQVPQFLRTLAEDAARTLELPVCGIDIMVARLPEPDSTVSELKPSIIEINSCPSLAMYENIDSREQLELVDKYLDMVIKY